MSLTSRTTGFDVEPIPNLQVRLFGPLTVQVAGAPLPSLRTRKGVWLLALLVLKHHHPLDRRWLAATLWPDSDHRESLKNLRNTLSDLRRALGLQQFRIQSPMPSTLHLDLAGAEVDLTAFDASIQQGDPTSLTHAVALYGGTLLQGCDEEWVVQERQQRELAYLQALESLAHTELQTGAAEQAVQHLRTALGIDVFRETAQCTLMTALAALGDYAGVTQVYREFRLQLHEQLHIQPAAETTALYQTIRVSARQIAAGGAAPLPPIALPLRLATSPQQHEELPIGRQAPHHNLPPPLTSFIGREKECTEVNGLLAQTRLLTLTGTGGSGKTRLSLEVVGERIDTYPDGVWLVELASLSDPTLVVQAVATALAIREQPGVPLLQTLVSTLRFKSLLLLLDNCEHLLASCAELAAALLRGCPSVRILATSRERLGIGGEQVYRLPSLSLPDLNVGLSVESIQEYESVRLFVARASLMRSDFRVSPQNMGAVAQVCHRLDGIPLAIELAAARVRSLSVEDLQRRLNDRFDLLTGGDRSALPRQQTLRGLIDWSYDLLSDPEKQLLQRLSVFVGGWTLEAAEAVCAGVGGRGSGVEEANSRRIDSKLAAKTSKPTGNATPDTRHTTPDEVLDLLTSLVDKSLVIAEVREERVRYRLLETVRAYTAEKLQANGATELVHNRHRDWFLTQAEEAESHLHGSEEALWLARLDTEHDNMRAAVAWCETAEDGAEAGLRLTGALWRFWRVRGYFGEGLNHLKRALEREGAKGRTAVRARALFGAGILAGRQDESAQARIFYEEAAMLWQELDVPGQVASAVHEQATLAFWLGDHARSQALHAEALTIWQELGDKRGIGESAINRGLFAYVQGDYLQARVLYEEGLTIMRELGNPEGITWALLSLAAAVYALGDQKRARSLRAEALMLARSVGDKANTAWALKSLADSAIDLGDHSQARTLYTEAVKIQQEIGQRGHYADAICKLADIAVNQGNYAEAHALYTESLTIHRETGQELHNLLGVAISMQGLAGALLTQGDVLKAVRLWGAVDAMSTSTGFVLPPHERARYDQLVIQARTALGEATFLTAWSEGQAMSSEQAAVYALEK